MAIFLLISEFVKQDSTTDIFKNMTGPGREGRDDQASLTLLAADGLGWDYPKLLLEMLRSSSILRVLRDWKLETK